jgi:hypothetical protein
MLNKPDRTVQWCKAHPDKALMDTWTKIQWGNHIADLVANGDDPSIDTDIQINHHYIVEASEVVRETVETIFWSNEAGKGPRCYPIRFWRLVVLDLLNFCMIETGTGEQLAIPTYTMGHLWGTRQKSITLKRNPRGKGRHTVEYTSTKACMAGIY